MYRYRYALRHIPRRAPNAVVAVNIHSGGGDCHRPLNGERCSAGDFPPMFLRRHLTLPPLMQECARTCSSAPVTRLVDHAQSPIGGTFAPRECLAERQGVPDCSPHRVFKCGGFQYGGGGYIPRPAKPSHLVLRTGGLYPLCNSVPRSVRSVRVKGIPHFGKQVRGQRITPHRFPAEVSFSNTVADSRTRQGHSRN